MEVKIIQVDFCEKGATHFDFYKRKIMDAVQGLDLSIVVLNAGIINLNLVINEDPSVMQQLMDTNLYHVVALLKLCLPILKKRGKPSSLITVSSSASSRALPYLTLYASSKAFVTDLTLALSKELSDSQVDILCSIPAITKTNILRDQSHKSIKKLESMFSVSSAQQVTETLRDLGHDKLSTGPFSHELSLLSMPIIDLLPKALVSAIFGYLN